MFAPGVDERHARFRSGAVRYRNEVARKWIVRHRHRIARARVQPFPHIVSLQNLACAMTTIVRTRRYRTADQQRSDSPLFTSVALPWLALNCCAKGITNTL